MKNKSLYFQTYFTSCTYKFYVSHHFHCYVKKRKHEQKDFYFYLGLEIIGNLDIIRNQSENNGLNRIKTFNRDMPIIAYCNL